MYKSVAVSRIDETTIADSQVSGFVGNRQRYDAMMSQCPPIVHVFVIHIITSSCEQCDIIIIIAEMAVFNVAGYLIEERRRWPVITASPRGQHSK